MLVGGAITHRQRPATAGGVTFLNLEDETRMVNAICSDGVVSLAADQLQPVNLTITAQTRDFR